MDVALFISAQEQVMMMTPFFIIRIFGNTGHIDSIFHLYQEMLVAMYIRLLPNKVQLIAVVNESKALLCSNNQSNCCIAIKKYSSLLCCKFLRDKMVI